MNIITAVYNFLWGDLITLPLPGGSSIGISLLVLLLVPAGIYFTIRTRFVLIRKFPHMIQIAMEKNEHSQAGSISGFQALIVATATRVGMGNLVGVVAAISAGGAGAVFWMWLLALLGSSTAFAEGTLAQIYRQKDPLYGGYRGGPAYYIHDFMTKKKTKKKTLVNGTYHSKDGRKIKGAIIPVKVDDLSRLAGFKRVSASNAEKVTVASASDSTYNDNLFDEEDDYTYAVLPKGYTPKVYKELIEFDENGKPEFSKFQGGCGNFRPSFVIVRYCLY